MIIHALQTGTPFVYEIFIVYAVIVHQTNISCSSEVPYGRANRVSYISLLFHTPCTVPLNRVSYISLLFHTPWIKLNEVIVYRVMMYANSLQIE